MTTIQEAVAACNAAWTETAKPIVRTIHDIENAMDWLYEMKDTYQREAALRPLEKAKEALLAQMDGIRDNAYCDAVMVQPDYNAIDAEWDAYEAFNNELHSSVVTVDAFVKQIGKEMGRLA